MSYEGDLAKLKRAVKRHRVRPLLLSGCCVCSAVPAPETRFGPRCERHRPADPSPSSAQGATLTPMRCTGPECTREAEVGELCSGHYMQQRRKGTLSPLRIGRPFPAQVAFNLTDELKARVTADAQRQGIDPAEWWRRAGEQALSSKNPRKSAVPQKKK